MHNYCNVPKTIKQILTERSDAIYPQTYMIQPNPIKTVKTNDTF